MKTWKLLLAFAGVPALLHAQTPPSAVPAPPVAVQKPYAVKGPVNRNDEYYWLRDDTRKAPEMLAHLNAENAYADAYLAPLKPLQERLYSEIIGRIKQDDTSVPVRERGYYYFSGFAVGADYPVIARRPGSLTAPYHSPNTDVGKRIKYLASDGGVTGPRSAY